MKELTLEQCQLVFGGEKGCGCKAGYITTGETINIVTNFIGFSCGTIAMFFYRFVKTPRRTAAMTIATLTAVAAVGVGSGVNSVCRAVAISKCSS